MKTIRANVFLNNIFQDCELSYTKKIHSVTVKGSYNSNLPTLLPGFIDLHVHGGGGSDIMEAGSALSTIATTHSKFGTTSFLATTMTSPFPELEQAFIDMKKSDVNLSEKKSKFLGVHLEGPFISSDKLGAQPNYTREATLKEIIHLNSILPIKIITLAPEIFNHLDLILELKKLDIVVQIGHTNGTYEDGVNALAQGAKSFTHLYNAMSGFHHRSPGIVGAALAHAEYAELIPDLEHVHPGAIKAALRAIPNLYFVTDSTAAAGMPDGEYKLGTQIVHKCLGGVRLIDGTLAGSALTMDQAFRNLLSIGITKEEASRRLSKIPAELIKEKFRGSIEVGNFADFVVFDEKNFLKLVIIEGDNCDI